MQFLDCRPLTPKHHPKQIHADAEYSLPAGSGLHLGFPTSGPTIRYKSRRPDQASLQMRIKELAAIKVSYGYRRIHVLLPRECGLLLNC